MTATHLDRTTLRGCHRAGQPGSLGAQLAAWLRRIGDASIHLFAHPGRPLPATDPEGRDLRISCGPALHHLRIEELTHPWH